MVRGGGVWGKCNIGGSREWREVIPAAEYLRMSYYEKWTSGLMDLLVKSGLVTPAEIDSGKRAKGSAKAPPPLTAAKVPTLGKGASTKRDVQVTPRFRVGQLVHTHNINPTGHTRLPRYARGKVG